MMTPFERRNAASTGHANHGGVPVRQPSREWAAEPQLAVDPQPAADPQSADSASVSVVSDRSRGQKPAEHEASSALADLIGARSDSR